MDLRELSGLVKPDPYPKGILAPYKRNDKALEKEIEQLRNEGQIVVMELPRHESDQDAPDCDRQLVMRQGIWRIEKI